MQPVLIRAFEKGGSPRRGPFAESGKRRAAMFDGQIVVTLRKANEPPVEPGPDVVEKRSEVVQRRALGRRVPGSKAHANARHQHAQLRRINLRLELFGECGQEAAPLHGSLMSRVIVEQGCRVFVLHVREVDDACVGFDGKAMLPLTDTVTQTDCYVQRIVIMGVASIASSVAYKKATGIVSDVEGRRRTDYFALALLRRL
ncbi:hypothetical protein PCAR4_990038 [Paraburkholderia caribensis]|nr:hypothetical protein PCAR4_990038 [Paraburkholderia caribensis]